MSTLGFATRRVREWLLSCGHSIHMLEHEHPGEPPTRPRMCSTCGRLRDIEAPAARGEFVCEQQCGVVSVDGHGFLG